MIYKDEKYETYALKPQKIHIQTYNVIKIYIYKITNEADLCPQNSHTNIQCGQYVPFTIVQ